MSERDKKKFEQMLASHSAPTLLGVKCANLFAVNQTELSLTDIRMYFQSQSALKYVSVRFLCRCGERALLYVYHKELLEMWLSDERVLSFLEEYGYDRKLSTDEMLDILAQRISCYDFPHEMGIFLGYPVDDVIGFIENRGANCIFCGFWKVYSDPETARKTFDKYVRCRDYLCSRINHGAALTCAVENYRRN